MEAANLIKEIQEDQFVCSICGNFLFEIEQISLDKIRLTCENCGQCHLIVVGSEDKNRFPFEFCIEDRNKLDVT